MKAGKFLLPIIILIAATIYFSLFIEKNAGSGVVPYLPLPELKKKVTN